MKIILPFKAKLPQTFKCLALIILLIQAVAVAVWIIFWPPSLISGPSHVPAQISEKYGVGFDITSPYGTATIKYQNGTVVNVGKIDAGEKHKEMMLKLSLDSSRRSRRPNFPSKEEMLRDFKRQIRKLLGLPATSDVGELAKLLKPLRRQTEIILGHKISAAVITIPHLAALYEEDLRDLFDYLGLTYLAGHPYWYGNRFCEAAATYAGNGFGLCSNFTDVRRCKIEEQDMPREYVLSITYTRSALTSSMARFGGGFNSQAFERPIVNDFTLGYEARHDNPNEDHYWSRVKDILQKPFVQENNFIPTGPVSRIFVYGECAEEAKFKTVLEEAFGSMLPNNPPIIMNNSLSSPAIGAAEMAMRISAGVGVPKTDIDDGHDNDL